MIRVLHVIHWFAPGGIETWLVDILHRINRADFQFDICYKGPSIGLSPEMAEEAEEAGARIFHCRQTPFRLWAGSRMRRIIAEGGYDIVHSHLGYLSHVTMSASRKAGTPVRIVHNHCAQEHMANWSSENRLLYFLRRAYVGRCRRICLRDATEAWYVSTSNLEFGHSEASIPGRAVYLGIPVEQFVAATRRQPVRRTLGIGDDEVVVGHVGRLYTQKNHATLVRAFARLARDGRARLVLVGDGRKRAELQALVAELGLGKKVQFLGLRRDAQELLQAMDIFAFPSLYEGLGLALLEAQAAGLPVVASDILEFREATPPIIHDRWLVPPTDHIALAERLAELIEQPDLRREIGEQCREYVREKFDRGRCLDNMLNLYRTLLDNE